MRFNIAFPASVYFKAQYLRRLEISKAQAEIIGKYEEVTGIQQTDIDALRGVIDLEQPLRDCVPDLEEANKNVVKFKSRSRRRGITLAIGIPVALVIGYGTGTLLSPR